MPPRRDHLSAGELPASWDHPRCQSWDHPERSTTAGLRPVQLGAPSPGPDRDTAGASVGRDRQQHPRAGPAYGSNLPGTDGPPVNRRRRRPSFASAEAAGSWPPRPNRGSSASGCWDDGPWMLDLAETVRARRRCKACSTHTERILTPQLKTAFRGTPQQDIRSRGSTTAPLMPLFRGRRRQRLLPDMYFEHDSDH